MTQLDEIILEHYPVKKKEALEHLGFAINEFHEMKVLPMPERTFRHKGMLKAYFTIARTWACFCYYYII